jgi:hypothetical protein
MRAATRSWRWFRAGLRLGTVGLVAAAGTVWVTVLPAQVASAAAFTVTNMTVWIKAVGHVVPPGPPGQGGQFGRTGRQGSGMAGGRVVGHQVDLGPRDAMGTGWVRQ